MYNNSPRTLPIPRKYAVGQRIGSLVLVEYVANGKWKMMCDCGSLKICRPADLPANGCGYGCPALSARKAQINRELKTKHGHNQRNSPTYVSWTSMNTRCHNPNNPGFEYWGGRGIHVCERWLGEHGFQNFLADMGPRPEGTSIDRIDVNGNYEPSNCRWSTDLEQQNNRRAPRKRGIQTEGMPPIYELLHSA